MNPWPEMFRGWTRAFHDEFFQSGYMRFETDRMSGVARVRGEHLDVLQIAADDALDSGAFREFIARAKEQFKGIAVWSIYNKFLAAALTRYGFGPAEVSEPWGETMTGMRWPKPKS